MYVTMYTCWWGLAREHCRIHDLIRYTSNLHSLPSSCPNSGGGGGGGGGGEGGGKVGKEEEIRNIYERGGGRGGGGGGRGGGERGGKEGRGENIAKRRG